MLTKGLVLVVDDQPSNIKLLTTLLKADGFEVISAGGGVEAIKIAKIRDPDVILLDVMMPDMDGFETTRALKSEPITTSIPVILITALDGAEARIKGLDAGADEFLSKPVNRTELIARVRSLLRLKQVQQQLRNKVDMVDSLGAQVIQLHHSAADTVLLVEDNAKVVKQLSLILGQKGYRIVVATSVEEATTLLNGFVPDLILLDYLLPVRNGGELITALKNNERFADIPVIVITSLDDLQNKVETIDMGVDDYIVKPVDNAELIARIRATLRRYKAHSKLKNDLERLYHSAVTDSLTNLNNRQFLAACRA
jgi:two-component system cell cycle response regulator